ncbi:RHS repeat-associated core domain-containing protein [Streptomyces sp. NPDC096153]|uniref:RHS repeat-associated core domain-containing protein n=1 Tax=Streptomyces sp. NPDC096153 TaxID=3155548 RepID=UPI00331A46E6
MLRVVFMFGGVRWRRRCVGVLASVLAGVVAVPVLGSPAVAEVSRPGNASALLAQAEAPAAVGLPGGLGGVGSSGDFSQSYPFTVPPGRKGMQPSLGLQYSSAGAVHGGVAAGWSLPVSAITLDPAAGTVRLGDTDGGSAVKPRNFVGPDGSPLVKDPDLPVSGGVGYRSVNDAGFVRFEYLAGVSSSPYWWRAFTRDGKEARFGLKSENPYGYAPLVSEVDGDGHELRYDYRVVGRTSDTAPAAGLPREFLLERVDYFAPGQNPDAGGTPYAFVSFSYAAPQFCGAPASLPAVGSRLNYRFGFGMLTGTRRLDSVTTGTPRTDGPGVNQARRYEFGYSASSSCSSAAEVTPYRELLSVQETVYAPNGSSKVLPPTEFTYGKASNYVKDSDYQSPVTVTNLAMPESIDTNPNPNGWRKPGSPAQIRCDVKFCAAPYVETEIAGTNKAELLSQAQAVGESVTRTWLDINGDGRLDLLSRQGGSVSGGRWPDLSAEDNSPTTGGCQIDVYVNKGSSGFVKNDGFGPFTLTDKMADIPVPGGTGATGAGELLCSLNRSFSPAEGPHAKSGTNPNFPSDKCTNYDHWGWFAGDGFKSWQQVHHGFYDVDGDDRPDLVSQPIASTNCPYVSTFGVPAPKYDDFETDPYWTHEVTWYKPVPGGEPGFGPAAYLTTKRQKYFYVYRNTGSGFASTPERVPVPFVADVLDGTTPGYSDDDAVARVPQSSVMNGMNLDGQAESDTKRGPQSLRDMNGDGLLDLVAADGKVFLGILGGGIRAESVTLPEGDANPPTTWTARDNDAGGDGIYWGFHKDGVGPDINGDGLADLATAKSTGTEIRFNNGFGFGTTADDGQVMFSDGAVETKRLDSFRVELGSESDWQEYNPEAQRRNETQMVDLDGDGLQDVLYFKPNESKLYLNGGRQWVRSTNVASQVAEALAGQVKGTGAVAEWGDRADYRHIATHQAVDVNGDGLLDLVENANDDGETTVRYARTVIDTSEQFKAPARLLRTVKNGYGATTTVTYGRNATAGKWTVSQVDTSPGQSEPVISTKYAYRGATKTAGPYGQAEFRGFGEVRSLQVGDSGDEDDLTTVSHYAFNQDYRGVLTRTATILGSTVFDDPQGLDPATDGGVMKVVENTYDEYPLGVDAAPGMDPSFPLQVVLPKTAKSYSCTGVNGQTLNSCVASAPSTTSKTTWTAKNSGGHFVMMLPSQSEVSFTDADGKENIRRTVATDNLAWTSSVFNVAPSLTVDISIVDGVEEELGRSSFAYHDTAYRLVKTQTVTDPDGADRTTRFAYYTSAANKGQVYKVWKPEQVARYGLETDAPGFTQFSYDANGVYQVKADFKATNHNVRQVTTSVVDPHTGALLETRGPDYVCNDSSDAGSEPDPASQCAFEDAKFQAKTVFEIDGLGRVTKTTQYPASDPAASGAGAIVQTASYNDSAFYNNGTAVSSTVRQGSGDGELSLKTTDLDGLGRAVRTADQLTSSVHKVVTYDYDAVGRPAKVIIPRADGGTTVGIKTSYDALGRVTQIAESHPGDRVFARNTYDGLTSQSEQVVDTDEQRPRDDSLGTLTRTTTDSTGRVVKVEEKTASVAGAPDPWAATSYRYDGADRLHKITDPDGAVTTLDHDYFGNRTSINRAGRTWVYGYDDNGSMTSSREPVPAGKNAEDFTHKVTYDDLGRVTQESPAPRDLTPAEQIQFKFGAKHYFYDQAHPSLVTAGGDQANYQMGRLSYTTSGVATNVNRYTSRGYLASTTQTMPGLAGILGAGADPLKTTNTTDATSGAVESTSYQALLPQGSTVTYQGPTVSTDYDLDGTPSAVQFAVGGKQLRIGQTRDDSGAVLQRSTNLGQTSGLASPQVTYNRDKYGRLTALTTLAGPSGEQRYKQELAYWDNGQVKTNTEQLGNTSVTKHVTNYWYDQRHQLTQATQTNGPTYNGQFTYTDGGRIKSAMVAATGAARAHVRNVDHIYQNPTTGDPQRLDTLRKTDGTTLASYLYDEAGNTTSRTIEGQTTLQRWDGARLRKATKANGEYEVYFYDGATKIAAARYKADGTLADATRHYGNLEIHHNPQTGPTYRQHIPLGGETLGRLDGNELTTEGTTFEHWVNSNQGHQTLALDATTGAATRRIASYGAFGELLTEQRAQGTPANKYTQEINGKDYDPTSGLHYYGHRWYDPLTVQWTSTDPLYRYTPDADPANPRTANLYTYTDNNPINRNDPNGLCTDYFTCAGEQIVGKFKDGLIASLEFSIGAFPGIGATYNLITGEGSTEALALDAVLTVAGTAIPGQADETIAREIVNSFDDIGRQADNAAVNAFDEGATIPTAGKSKVVWENNHFKMETTVGGNTDGNTPSVATEMVFEEGYGRQITADFHHADYSPRAKVFVLDNPDAVATQAAQAKSVGVPRGTYETPGNDCSTYVCDMLRAGGLNPPVPTAGMTQEKWGATLGRWLLRNASEVVMPGKSSPNDTLSNF